MKLQVDNMSVSTKDGGCSIVITRWNMSDSMGPTPDRTFLLTNQEIKAVMQMLTLLEKGEWL